MAIRSIENWKEILAPMVADHMSLIGERILGDLTHYKTGGPYHDDDCHTLGNALEAWEQLGKE
jgi:hypothetical protein